MVIYTKGGDGGSTSLYNGERVEKNHPRIIALGYLDELTSQLGVVRAKMQDPNIKKQIKLIQGHMIDLMALVAGVKDNNIVKNMGRQVENLEKLIDAYSTQIPKFSGFILPGETELSSEIDLARSIARKAERGITSIVELPQELRKYINRLSDYLYIIARYMDTVENKNPNYNCDHITRKIANNVIEDVVEYAKYNGCNVVVAILSKSGNPISVQAMENAFIVSYELAIKKAYTAASLQMPTHELAKLTREGGEFEGLEGMIDGNKLITLGGGYPIVVNGNSIGAIGVSGGSESQDIDFAKYGALMFEGE